MKLSTPVTAKSSAGEATFDGEFVILKRKRFHPLGKGTKSLHISHITAVQWKPPGRLLAGFIEFTLPGGVERQSTFGSRTTEAVRNENAMTFGRREEAAFEALREAVQSAINAAHEHPAPTLAAADPIPGGDIAARLREIAKLHDEGILSDEEFAAAKQRTIRS